MSGVLDFEVKKERLFLHRGDHRGPAGKEPGNGLLFHRRGADTVFELCTWYDFERLFKITKFICVRRQNHDILKLSAEISRLRWEYGAADIFIGVYGPFRQLVLHQGTGREGREIDRAGNRKTWRNTSLQMDYTGNRDGVVKKLAEQLKGEKLRAFSRSGGNGGKACAAVRRGCAKGGLAGLLHDYTKSKKGART